MSATDITNIHAGSAAIALIADAAFRAEWNALLAHAGWSTPFQRVEFAGAWYDAYSTVHEPLLVVVRDANQELVGLFAAGRSGGGTIPAGGWQVEYPCWLARDADITRVFDAVVDELERSLGRQSLLLRYLPPRFPLARLLANSRHRDRLAARPFKRPVMDTADPRIGGSLRKKGNKSKLSRLRRRGAVELKVCSDAAALDAAFDTIIAQYDARQKSNHGVAPFQIDAHKRAFHLELMRRGLLHVCILQVGGRIGAAHLGAKGAHEVHLSIVSFDPEMAGDSPNKLLLLMMAERLAADGIRSFDLTPAGDAWKDRFATRFDQVHELTLFSSAFSCGVARLKNAARRAVKRLLLRPVAANGAGGAAADQPSDSTTRMNNSFWPARE